jgi:biopolymer transport protein TolR
VAANALPGGRFRFLESFSAAPLIDVLLVLLIIFMVIAPSISTGLDASIPQKPFEQKEPPRRDDIVVTVLAKETVLLNQDVVPLADLDARLRRLFKIAGNHVLFIRGDRQLDFQQVAQVIDIARGAGLDRIGLMTE